MLIAELSALIKIVLILDKIFGLTFMMACTVFVIVCIIQSDIKISIVKNEDEKEQK